MTPDEASKVAHLALAVDGGCSSCSEDLLLNLQVFLDEYDWIELANAHRHPEAAMDAFSAEDLAQRRADWESDEHKPYTDGS